MYKGVAVVGAIIATLLFAGRDASAQCTANSTVCAGNLCCNTPYSYCCPGNMCSSSSTCTGALKCASNAVQCVGFCCPPSAPTCCPNGTCSASSSCASGKGGSGGGPPGYGGSLTGNGGSPGVGGSGCDGDKEKGVMVPCAGIDFCTCAGPCTTKDDCHSGCCQGSVCVPACVCDGNGSVSECKVGDSANDPRASESGGCSIGDTGGVHGAGIALLALLGLRRVRGAAGRKQQRRCQP